MFPNVRLMVVAILAAIAGISCGLGLFATFRVNHEPLARLAEGSPPLQLALNNRALGRQGCRKAHFRSGDYCHSNSRTKSWAKFRAKSRAKLRVKFRTKFRTKSHAKSGARNRRAWTAGGSGTESTTGCGSDCGSSRADGDYQCRSARSAAGREAEKNGREQSRKAGSQSNALGASTPRRQDGSRPPNGG